MSDIHGKARGLADEAVEAVEAVGAVGAVGAVDAARRLTGDAAEAIRAHPLRAILIVGGALALGSFLAGLLIAHRH